MGYLLLYAPGDVSEMCEDQRRVREMDDTPEELCRLVLGEIPYCRVSHERSKWLGEWLARRWPELRLDVEIIDDREA